MATSIAYTSADSRLEIIRIDATTQLTHTTQVSVPEHPVEKGSDISDHVHPKNRSLRLECVISDYPLKSSGESGYPGRARELYEKLTTLQETGIVVEIRTSLLNYLQMVISDMTVPQTVKEGRGGLKFSIAARGIRFVDTQTVAIKPTRLKSGKPTENKGPKTGENADDTTVRGSMLWKLKQEGNSPEALKKAVLSKLTGG